MLSLASGISCFLSASSPPLGSINSPLYISNSSSVTSLSSFGSSVKLSAALFLEFINLSDAAQSLASLHTIENRLRAAHPVILYHCNFISRVACDSLSPFSV